MKKVPALPGMEHLQPTLPTPKRDMLTVYEITCRCIRHLNLLIHEESMKELASLETIRRHSEEIDQLLLIQGELDNGY